MRAGIACASILLACCGVHGAAFSDFSLGKLEDEDRQALLRVVVETNIAAVKAIQSVRYSGVRETKFDKAAFGGLENESTKVEFSASGGKYGFVCEVKTIPEVAGSTRFTCVYDGENWGRLEEDQYRILFTSKSDQRDKVAVVGTNFFLDPFLPVNWLSQQKSVYGESFYSDLSSVGNWGSFLNKTVSAEVVQDEGFGKLAAVKVQNAAGEGVEDIFTVFFALEKNFYPVKWRMSSGNGNSTEFSILELGKLPVGKSGLVMSYPKKSRLIRHRDGKQVSESESRVATLEVNADIPDGAFALPVEDASAVLDMDTNVAIPIPK